MSVTLGRLIINSHDYTQYVKGKTGFQFERENTNAEKAGRDKSEVMHTLVTSHQRKLTLRLGPMPFDTAKQLETDLQGNDDGVQVQYPDLYDGLVTRLFYNTSIEAAYEYFTADGIMVDNISFTLITVKEATVNAS